MGRRRGYITGHCSPHGQCERCPSYIRNGDRAPKPLAYCHCKCHPPVRERREQHETAPPITEPVYTPKADKCPQDVKGKDVRQWARARGMDVPDRGRMPKHILNLYLRDKVRQEAA